VDLLHVVVGIVNVNGKKMKFCVLIFLTIIIVVCNSDSSFATSLCHNENIFPSNVPQHDESLIKGKLETFLNNILMLL